LSIQHHFDSKEKSMELTVQGAGSSFGIAQIVTVWPDAISHKRHVCYLALIGGLLRSKWTVPRVEQLVRDLAAATNDEEAASRVADVASTARCLEHKQPAYGWTRLAEELGTPATLQIRLAVGAALTVETLSAAKKLPADLLRSLGVRDGEGKDTGKVLIDYRDEKGDVVATRKRFNLASRPYWAKGVHALAYGRERLAAATVAGHLILVEGESDSWTLWHHRQPALGIPGAECTKVLDIPHVSPFRTLYAVEEADTAGPKFIDNVRKRLGALGWSGELRIVRDFGAKDVSELHLQSPTRFLEKWKAAVEAAQPVSIITPSEAGSKLIYRPLPRFQPFPVDALPPVLSELVPLAAESIGCDDAAVACHALAVVAGCIGNACALQVKRRWIEPAVIWSLVIARSGKVKSPGWQVTVDPLFDLQLDLFDQHNKEMEEYELELAAWQSLPKDKRGDKPTRPPPCQTFLTSDTTIEALAELLADNPHGLLSARDEADAWFRSFTRYRGKDSNSDRPQWLEMHRAGTLIIHRRTGERRRLSVRRAAVSLTGTIQPEVLCDALNLDALQAGLGARFLFVMPPSKQRAWTEASIPDGVARRYRRLLCALLSLPLADPEKRRPYLLDFSPEAKKLWVTFFNEWGRIQFAAEGEQAAAFAKIEAYALRLMLVHHVISCVHARGDTDAPDSAENGQRLITVGKGLSLINGNRLPPITKASAEAGIRLARWFAGEAGRVYMMLSESEEERQTRRLVEWIRSRGGRVTSRDLQRSNWRRWPTSDVAERDLQKLVDAGLGRWTEGDVPERGGYTPRWFELFYPTSDIPTLDFFEDSFADPLSETPPDTCCDTRFEARNGSVDISDLTVLPDVVCASPTTEPENRVSECRTSDRENRRDEEAEPEDPSNRASERVSHRMSEQVLNAAQESSAHIDQEDAPIQRPTNPTLDLAPTTPPPPVSCPTNPTLDPAPAAPPSVLPVPPASDNTEEIE
jgi:hypothetical protein